MFVPLKFNLRHVDAVLRYVPPPPLGTTPCARKKRTKVEIYAVQITLQSFKSHRESLEFFSHGGDHEKYAIAGEDINRCMLWISTSQPNVDKMLPTPEVTGFSRYRQKAVIITIAN